MKAEFRRLLVSGSIIIIGLFLLKIIPMYLFGESILFDASAHLAVAIFILYGLWFFIDQDRGWRIPYFIFAFFILTVISLQRIVSYNHNDFGLLLGLILGLFGVGVAEWNSIRDKFEF